MRTRRHTFTCAALALAMVAALPQRSAAQQQQSSPKPANPFGVSPGPVTPLKVQVVFSRYASGKKVSNLPFILIVNANDGLVGPEGRYAPFSVSRLRTGAEVPLSRSIVREPRPDGSAVAPIGSTGYRSIGTSIDCYANSADDGRYRVDVQIEDNSVYPGSQGVESVTAAKEAQVFRTFSSKNTLMLKVGQSVEFSGWADRITGEETRVTVTLQAVP